MTDYRFRDAASNDEPRILAIIAAVLSEFGLQPDGADPDVDGLVGDYARRGGIFRVLVSPTDEIVGCGGLYPIDDAEIEIRKMYYLPEARGRGLGRAMLEDLISTARASGYQRIVLETASNLTDAIALYLQNGFVRVPRSPMTCRCDRVYQLELGERPVE